jgi:hypothetical protein
MERPKKMIPKNALSGEDVRQMAESIPKNISTSIFRAIGARTQAYVYRCAFLIVIVLVPPLCQRAWSNDVGASAPFCMAHQLRDQLYYFITLTPETDREQRDPPLTRFETPAPFLVSLFSDKLTIIGKSSTRKWVL